MSVLHTLPALLQVAVDRQAPLDFWPWFFVTLLKLLVFFTLYLVIVAYSTLAERKISAWIQGRHGPNRVGPRGYFQPLADGVKNFMKEETLPPHVNKAVFIIAPMLSFIPALLVWAIIPWGAAYASPLGRIDMVLADLPIGFLFILAIGSLGVYGIVLAGWGSNNKYALLGGLRSSAQMISYEISMGMSLIPVLLIAGNVTLRTIVNQQAEMHAWNVITLSVAFVTYLISAFAETNRLPFDLPEAESELVTGYHTEYSAMKFSMFMISEYANMLTQSAMLATLFLGGWDIPFMTADNTGAVSGPLVLLSVGIMMAKTLFFMFFYIWIRWTLPRFRYDQLMSLGWKLLLPLALAYIVIVATLMLVLDAAGIPRGFAYAGIFLAVNAVILFVAFWRFDRGRVLSPAFGRASAEELARLRGAAAARAHLSTQAGD
ncbi:MAG: NADH-quinone oxidoreductase subunit NuoH [Gemmatimonadaceae bacterium]|nr:NADH-quinone oxidoreductase subunit NuoH [Gemmatimonadaceae bacterium]